MAGINKAIIIGHIGKLEAFVSGTGNTVVNFSVATSSNYTDNNGNKVQQTEWHKVVAFKKVAEIVSQYGSKGKQIFVEGYLKTEKYNKDGIDMYSTKIIAQSIQFLGKKDDVPAEGGSNYAGAENKASPSAYAKKDEVPFDDDIPF